MIELVEKLAITYPHHRAIDRLKQANLTEGSYSRLSKKSHKRTVRESAIPEEDLTEALTFFFEHPDVGAGKARQTLIEKEKALISVANLNNIKHVAASSTSQIYNDQEELKKVVEAQLREDLAKRKKADYKHQKATYPHHIWAIDFVNIVFLGMRFVLCVVYDEYSQEYCAIGVGMGGDQYLAVSSFEQAFTQSSAKPKLLRRDNGKPFETEDFQEILLRSHYHGPKIGDYPVPPGCPWFNGALESCNRSLKAALKTTGMQKMAIDPAFFRQVRKSTCSAQDALVDIVSAVRTMLNKEIARMRHGMTPAQVISGENEGRAKQNAFIARKREERKERMAAIRSKPRKNPKTLLAKTRAIANRMAKKMGINELYALNEVLHHRFQMFET